MRENRMLRSTWRGLETWFGRKLINTGAPVPDPTDERGGETEGVPTRNRALPRLYYGCKPHLRDSHSERRLAFQAARETCQPLSELLPERRGTKRSRLLA